MQSELLDFLKTLVALDDDGPPEKPPITDRLLPPPASKYGFLYAQLEEFFTPDEFEEFKAWMDRQTVAVDSELGVTAIYPQDVHRFISGRRSVID